MNPQAYVTSTIDPSRSSGEGVARTLFIRGIMPRSGTNFLADILGCHLDVVRSPGQFWEFVPFRFQDELQHYVNQIAASKHAHEFDASAFLPLLGDAWLRFLASEVTESGTAVFKEPSVDRLEAMFDMFPTSIAVIVVRDGRDIVSSQLNADFALPKFQWWNRHHWRRLLPDEAFRVHCRSFRRAADTLNRFLASPSAQKHAGRFLLVKYEQLVETPRDEIERILDWAQLSIDRFDWARFASMPVRGSSFLRNEAGQHDFGQGVEKPAEGFRPLGRWKSWSPRRIASYRRIVGDVACRFGYGDEAVTEVAGGSGL